MKIERLIVHKRAPCAVRTSLRSTYDPVASFRGAGIDRYRSGMPRVGAARSLFILFPGRLRSAPWEGEPVEGWQSDLGYHIGDAGCVRIYVCL